MAAGHPVVGDEAAEAAEGGVEAVRPAIDAGGGVEGMAAAVEVATVRVAAGTALSCGGVAAGAAGSGAAELPGRVLRQVAVAVEGALPGAVAEATDPAPVPPVPAAAGRGAADRLVSQMHRDIEGAVVGGPRVVVAGARGNTGPEVSAAAVRGAGGAEVGVAASEAEPADARVAPEASA